MKLKNYIAAILLLLLQSRLQGQTPLQVGDKVPDVLMSDFINAPFKQTSLSAFKGKIILLDFWATWCSPCVKSMPKLNSLQAEFKNEAQIIPVTYQTSQEIDELFKHMPAEAKLNIPILAADTTLHKLFPHVELPHYVWIDANGIVKDITGGDAVTADNFNKLIANSTITAAQKKDVFIPVDKTTPLFLNNNGGTPAALMYHAVFTGYQPGLTSELTSAPLQDTNLTRLTATNVSLPDLFKLAYAYNGELSARNRMLLEVKNKDAIFWNEKGAVQSWMEQHTYCYELVAPNAMEHDLQHIMQTDLDRLLPKYKGGIEKRTVKCLVLTATPKAKALITTTAKPVYKYNAYSLHIEHGLLVGFTNLLSVIYLQNLSTPVINGTGINEPINLDIETNLSDINGLRSALQPLGLDLVEQETQIEMIVIKDR